MITKLRNGLVMIPIFGLVVVVFGCGESTEIKVVGPEAQSSTDLKTQNEQDPALTDGLELNLRCDLEFKKLALCAQMTWLRGPQWNVNTEEPMVLRLEFWNPQSKQRVDLAYELDFDSAMPAMNNHPLATKPRIIRDEGLMGVFTVQDIRISCLGGDWTFFFLLRKEQGLLDQTRFVWVRDDHLID